jgi:hypothetical protein
MQVRLNAMSHKTIQSRVWSVPESMSEDEYKFVQPLHTHIPVLVEDTYQANYNYNVQDISNETLSVKKNQLYNIEDLMHQYI